MASDATAHELIPGEVPERAQSQGFATAYLANVTRVGGDLPGADRAFARAWSLWRRGAEGAAPGPLQEWRLSDLEASLRRDQRRWDQALALSLRAQATAPREQLGRILLLRGSTLEQAGRPEEALTVLEEALPLVAEAGDPRLYVAARFNILTNLGQLDRFQEAEALLPEVRELVIGLRNEVDLIRVLWLSGRVDAGLGRREEARAALEQARSSYAQRKMSFDTALVSLELAVLLLEDGRTEEAKAEGEALVAAFSASGVYREALADDLWRRLAACADSDRRILIDLLVALLRHAAALFSRGGDLLEEGATLVDLGQTQLDAGDALDALGPLTWARRLLIPEVAPAAWRAANLACACAWAATGELGKAQQIEAEVAAFDAVNPPATGISVASSLGARLARVAATASSPEGRELAAHPPGPAARSFRPLCAPAEGRVRDAIGSPGIGGYGRSATVRPCEGNFRSKE